MQRNRAQTRVENFLNELMNSKINRNFDTYFGNKIGIKEAKLEEVNYRRGVFVEKVYDDLVQLTGYNFSSVKGLINEIYGILHEMYLLTNDYSLYAKKFGNLTPIGKTMHLREGIVAIKNNMFSNSPNKNQIETGINSILESIAKYEKYQINHQDSCMSYLRL